MMGEVERFSKVGVKIYSEKLSTKYQQYFHNRSIERPLQDKVGIPQEVQTLGDITWLLP
jgi:hypothetical protein